MESLRTALTASITLPSNAYKVHRPTEIILSYARNCNHPPPALSSSFTVSLFGDLSARRSGCKRIACKSVGSPGEEEGNDLEEALHMGGDIPENSVEFVRQVSSRAYYIRHRLERTIGCSSYDVLEANPWREVSKLVYVLTQRENQLCTMRTRSSRSEVEKELRLLFPKGEKQRSEAGSMARQSRDSTEFWMVVEDIREGVLVFEDEQDAVKYCNLLQGGDQGCEGVAKLEASSVFDICHKMRALAILFRRGRTPPLPENLKLNLEARKRSIEDQEDFI
ncbi:uncharacterized protein [Aristolochia californica]|uniref:uncharacterized protein n=1 Tax=Aristolochia californica TaxID=171875 RepID=UPI0035D605DA